MQQLTLPGGKRVTVSRGELRGQVESLTVEGAIGRIRGWAADVENVAPVDRVLLFSGRRLLFESDTPVYRWDIGGISGTPGLQHIGFVAELPVRDLEGADLRAIAVRGDRASELDWPRRMTELVAVRGQDP